MIRWTFLRAPQEVVWSDADFVRFTRSTVADLRAAYARYPGEPGIDSLVTELLALSPRFAQMWAEHAVEVRGLRRTGRSRPAARLGPARRFAMPMRHLSR
jgi:hypothetical protein